VLTFIARVPETSLMVEISLSGRDAISSCVSASYLTHRRYREIA